MRLPATLAARDLERGQALALLAAGFIGIAAFIGMAIDAGILFSNVGHLRRATDAASLAAANQFREGRTPIELSSMATEYLELNGLSPSGVVAKICDLGSPGSSYDDASLCPGGTNPPSGSDTPRKYVRVETTLPVNFAFLPIIGFDSTTIRAESISEAASVDLVLAIDVSDSMSIDLCYDGLDNDGDGLYDECSETTGPGTEGVDGTFDDDVDLCLAETLATAPSARLSNPNTCHPFEEVRDAAQRLVTRMYFPYDRISIVTFGRLPTIWLELNDTDSLPAVCNPYTGPTKEKDCAQDVLDEIQVEPSPLDNPALCEGTTPRGCMSTNIGDGLLHSGGRFCIDDGPPASDAGNGACDRGEMREEAVWIVILLTDGAANAGTTANPPSWNDWICPSSTYSGPGEPAPPYCRDDSASTRHSSGDPEYDADDYARDQADFVGCPGEYFPLPGCATVDPDGGMGAVIFTIGLGSFVTDNPDDPNEPRAGELFLRYAAAAGDDGNPATDPCSPDPGKGKSCGNYYFSPTGAGLIKVFEDIASRIFTRIAH